MLNVLSIKSLVYFLWGFFPPAEHMTLLQLCFFLILCLEGQFSSSHLQKHRNQEYTWSISCSWVHTGMNRFLVAVSTLEAAVSLYTRVIAVLSPAQTNSPKNKNTGFDSHELNGAYVKSPISSLEYHSWGASEVNNFVYVYRYVLLGVPQPRRFNRSHAAWRND